jgi:hypothetical protein
VESTDQIRVFVQGYKAECIDSQFGQLFGQSAYLGGLSFITTCGLTDNTNLGGALLTLPPVPASAGQYTVSAGHFQTQVNVVYVSSP